MSHPKTVVVFNEVTNSGGAMEFETREQFDEILARAEERAADLKSQADDPAEDLLFKYSNFIMRADLKDSPMHILEGVQAGAAVVCRQTFEKREGGYPDFIGLVADAEGVAVLYANEESSEASDEPPLSVLVVNQDSRECVRVDYKSNADFLRFQKAGFEAATKLIKRVDADHFGEEDPMFVACASQLNNAKILAKAPKARQQLKAYAASLVSSLNWNEKGHYPVNAAVVVSDQAVSIFSFTPLAL